MSRSRRNSNERVGMSFSQITRGMRVFLQGLEGTESHLNGKAVTVLALQPATGFCTIECDDRSTWHVEPMNMSSSTTGEGGPAEKTPRWRKVEGTDGRTYYHNVETNETSWQRPAELDPVVSPPPRQHGSGLSQAMGALNVGATRAPNAATFRGDLAPAPAPTTDWREVSSSDGRTYYHNSRTNETAWQRPAELDPPAAASPPERRRQRRFDAADSHPAPHVGQAPALTSRTSDAHSFLSSLDPPAPATNWREVSSSDGRTYYHNSRTNETTWQRPAELDPQPQPSPLEGEQRRRRRGPGDEAAEPPQPADRRFPPSSYSTATPPRDRYGQPAESRDRYGQPAEPPRDRYGQPAEPPRDRYGQPAEPPRDRYGQPAEPVRPAQSFLAATREDDRRESYAEADRSEAQARRDAVDPARAVAPRDRFGQPDPPRERYGQPADPPRTRPADPALSTLAPGQSPTRQGCGQSSLAAAPLVDGREQRLAEARLAREARQAEATREAQARREAIDPARAAPRPTAEAQAEAERRQAQVRRDAVDPARAAPRYTATAAAPAPRAYSQPVQPARAPAYPAPAPAPAYPTSSIPAYRFNHKS